MSLLTIGTVAFDTVETPFGRAEYIIGGACTYISYAASYFTNQINSRKIVSEKSCSHYMHTHHGVTDCIKSIPSLTRSTHYWKKPTRRTLKTLTPLSILLTWESRFVSLIILTLLIQLTFLMTIETTSLNSIQFISCSQILIKSKSSA